MITRRKLMMAAGALPLGALAQPLGALAHPDMGRVIPPRLLPRIAVLRDDGLRTTVDSLLIGRVTAVQLMFTGCSTVCPIQGALFAAAQRVPLVSLSVDPLADDPAALTAWLAKHRARALWRAAVPTPEALDVMRSFFAQAGDQDDHSTQVYVFDRAARLVWRTAALPAPETIIGAVEHFSSR